MTRPIRKAAPRLPCDHLTNPASKETTMTDHPTLRRLVSLTASIAVATVAIASSATTARAAAPSNDDFADATPLILSTGGSIQFYGATQEATTEPSEPSHHPDGVTPTSASIWYTYTPTTDGNLDVGVIASNASFDPVVAIYTGSSVSALTRIAANDDARSGQTRSQILSVPIVAATTYHIAVAVKSGTPSGLQLTYAQHPAPSNDSVGNPASLQLNWSDTTWNIHASAQAGEPEIVPPNAAKSTIWWVFTAPHNGTLSLTTLGSSIDTLLGVFRQDGTSTPWVMSDLTRIAANDDANPGTSTSSIANLEVKAGKIYRIAVDGFDGAQGLVTLTTTWTQSAFPDNDDFADAAPMTGAYSFTGSTNTATVQPDEPQHLATGTSGHSVWYSYKPSVDQTAHLELGSSGFDVVVALYRGSALSNLVKIAEDRGAAAPSPRPTQLSDLKLKAGVQYYLAIAGAGSAAGTLGGTFKAVNQPTLATISPGRGPLAGGNWITITGTNLSGAQTTVKFGSAPATQVTGDDFGATVIQARVPSGLPAGPVAVTVSTDGGTAANAPTYLVGQPSIGALSQGFARLSGGEKVTVTGSDFAGIPLVMVGGVAASSVNVISPTTLTFVTPKHSAGVAKVTMSTVSGASPTVGNLVYLDRPTITKLSRTKGPHRGGFRVTISGRNILAVKAVLVGSKSAKFSFKSGKLVVTMPRYKAHKKVTIRVVTPGGTSARVKKASFRYR